MTTLVTSWKAQRSRDTPSGSRCRPRRFKASSTHRRLACIDANTIARLEPLAVGALDTRAHVRVAAIEALEAATADAVPSARKLCLDVLASTGGATTEADDVIVAAAKTLIAIGGDAAYIAERWRKSTGWLRQRLEAILRDAR